MPIIVFGKKKHLHTENPKKKKVPSNNNNNNNKNRIAQLQIGISINNRSVRVLYGYNEIVDLNVALSSFRAKTLETVEYIFFEVHWPLFNTKSSTHINYYCDNSTFTVRNLR